MQQYLLTKVLGVHLQHDISIVHITLDWLLVALGNKVGCTLPVPEHTEESPCYVSHSARHIPNADQCALPGIGKCGCFFYEITEQQRLSLGLQACKSPRTGPSYLKTELLKVLSFFMA